MEVVEEGRETPEDAAYTYWKSCADPGVRRTLEFHTRFDCFVATQPDMLVLPLSEAGVLSYYVNQMRILATGMKMEAARANERGSRVLGLYLIRLQLHLEEAGVELGEAMLEGDLVKAFDALLDSSYVVDGTYLTFGLGHLKEAGAAVVHSSNMSKLGADGQPIISDAGRVVKGPNYQPPGERLAELVAGRG